MLATTALLCCAGLPLALAFALAAARLRPFALALAPWAALPALLVALSGWPSATVELPWLLVGTTLGLDDTSRVFLLLTAALWLVCGHYAAAYHAHDPHRVRMSAYWLATLAGNLLLILAGDAVTFYLGFLTMGLCAYGLIVHDGTDEARRAGTVYLALVILGEALILPALWLAVAQAASIALDDMASAVAADPLTLGLLVAGFGIKAALVPLHVWLPVAHPVAPTPASAVLSGAMVKAGVLGWLVLLPLGELAAPALGAALIGLGLAGAFGAALAGCAQARPKAVLAYSSVSQLGLLAAALGMAFLDVSAAAPAVLAITLYAVHHAFAKGALFLGVGCVQAAPDARRRRRALALLLLPGLALAGLPFTSGAVAKTALKHVLPELTDAWYGVLDTVLPLAAIGTTLLMARFGFLLWHEPVGKPKPGLAAPWLVLLGMVAVVGFVPALFPSALIEEALAPSHWWGASWPVLLGLVLAGAAARWWRRAPRVPEGDILWPIVACVRAVGARIAWRRASEAWAALQDGIAARSALAWRLLDRRVGAGERWLTAWPVLAGAMLAAIVLAWWLVRAQQV
ncbi:NADH/ubiquinone/plastoquinone (complex I) [Verticiella sediminum]|uniref:NADH/ubiquinone/plastoquinone (Complex I) n=1 Tax=Verticiella sediminum TaxID=1247510 RepID=A0A556ABW2_9BURK|nr:complex I subunit 5 family protein [Verticiella sediminum]TSH90357.1 NADH/ubiquinone/plastoquinone (complex I) [Verticiella sediminum]